MGKGNGREGREEKTCLLEEDQEITKGDGLKRIFSLGV